jgi:hypothetical protein
MSWDHLRDVNTEKGASIRMRPFLIVVGGAVLAL